MPPKRRLRRGDSESSEDPAPKRTRATSEVAEDGDKVKDMNSQAVYKEIIDHLYSLTDSDDRFLYEEFEVLPSKEEFPVYYDYIENPIDFKKIKKKIQSKQYSDIDDFESDIMLLITNARAFNEPRAQISKDATCLKRAFLAKKAEIKRSCCGRGLRSQPAAKKSNRRVSVESTQSGDEEADEDSEEEDEDEEDNEKENEEGEAGDEDDDEAEEDSIMEESDEKHKDEKQTPKKNEESNNKVGRKPKSPNSSGGPTKDDGMMSTSFEPNTFSILYDYIVSFADQVGRRLSAPFLRLPIRRVYPDYYEVVKKPLSLCKLRTKIKSNYYNDLSILEKDFNLIFDNAQMYYAPGTQQHSDAMQLQMIMRQKKSELEQTPEYIEMREGMPEKGTPQDVDVKNQHSSQIENQRQLIEVKPKNSTTENLLLSPPPAKHFTLKQLGTTRSIRRKNKVESKKIEVKYFDGSSSSRQHSKTNKCFGCSEEHSHSSSIKTNNSSRRKSSDIKRGRPSKSLLLAEEGSPSFAHRRKTLRESTTPYDPNDPAAFKQRLMMLYNCVLEYKDSDSRVLSEIFIELPDKEEYPEYYKVIPNPIDMEMIRKRVEISSYTTEEEFIEDFEIMFQNARHFNEESSEIYEDSIVLEKALKKKKRWLQHLGDGKNTSPVKQPKQQGKQVSSGEFATKCSQLLAFVRNYTDHTGRCLASMFERLPSKHEYPEYYMLIKRPIDLSYISSRVNKYTCLDDLEQDILLMFDNACHFNDPDSQIYKDALTLLRVMISKKNELQPEDENTFNVQALVKALLSRLYENVMGHKDEEGRCYSDSLLELEAVSEDSPNRKKIMRTIQLLAFLFCIKLYVTFYKKKVLYKTLTLKIRKPISLPIIGQLLDLNFYKRLDRLQEDFFTVFTKARKDGRTDSEMYEDACELQIYFILERDRLTKDGLRLQSSVVNFTSKSIQSDIDLERKEKQKEEGKENENGSSSSEHEKQQEDDSWKQQKFRAGKIAVEVQPEEDGLTYTRSVIYKGYTYRVGDFVYVKAEEPNRPPHILFIEKVWAQKDGLQGLYGCWYYRPEATFHLASRKFMEKEVFRSHQSSNVLVSAIVGQCYVMNVKDYPRLKPLGFKDHDVYVCESKYNAKTKTFKKLKIFPPPASHVMLGPRPEVIEIKRISSIFAGENQAERKEKPVLKDQMKITDTEEYAFAQDKNVELVQVPNPEPGCTYYDKYNDFKLGDCVYVKTDEGYHFISKIDSIWINAEGVTYFRGNWYIQPEDTKHLPTQQFFQQEVFESNIVGTFSVNDVLGKCVILNLRDYQYCEVKRYRKSEVEITVGYHLGGEPLQSVFRPFGSPPSYNVAFYSPMKRVLKRVLSKHVEVKIQRLQLPSYIRDDEFWYFDEPINPKRRPSSWLMPQKSANNEANETALEPILQGVEAGFVLFNKEHAAVLSKEVPVLSKDDMRVKTLEKWKSMTKEEKEGYRQRAQSQGLLETLVIYKCAWSNCEYQFEDQQDLMVHVMEGVHIVKSAAGNFPCEWKDCSAKDKDNTKRTFATHSRLVRHIRELHFNNARSKIYVGEKTKFYFPRHQTCEDGYRSGGNSDRASSRASSIISPLSPNAYMKQAILQQKAIGMFQNMAPNPMVNNLPNTQMQMQAGMFPPYRMGGQATPQALMQQQILQQQILQQQQQRGGVVVGSPRHPLQQQQQHVPTTYVPIQPQPTSHQQQQQQQQQQHILQQMSQQQQIPPQGHLQQQQQMQSQQGMVPLEQHEMLVQQTQRQQQEIQQLHQQVATLTQQTKQQQQQILEEQQRAKELEERPVFVAPPVNTQKLRHSEAYLRYIEGLRDNRDQMSCWKELEDVEHNNRPSQHLPNHWFGATDHGFASTTDALWALRDHMLRDSVALSKFV